MRVFYKEKEITNTSKSYNSLIDKPYLNNVELLGNVTLNDINVYSKNEVDKLIAGARAVNVVSSIPSVTYPNTMYYIGPLSDGSYDIYMCDDVNTMIYLGSTSMAEYKSGNGIEVDIVSNKISARLGNGLQFSSEGKIEAVYDEEISSSSTHGTAVTPKAVHDFVMVGATTTTSGVRGLVPAPSTSDVGKFLSGTGAWVRIPTVTVSPEDPSGGQDGDIWIKEIYS